MHMFCFQCQETSEKKGCTSGGVCGKSEETANYQDLLIHLLKGIGLIAEAGATPDREGRTFILEALYATVTNTNFDPDRIRSYVRQALELKRRLLCELPASARAGLPEPAQYDETDENRLRGKAYSVGVMLTADPDVRSLRETVTYGLKGISAYATHALLLGHERPDVAQFVCRALAAVATESSLDRLLDLALETGRTAVETMAMLDAANAAAFGEPKVTRFSLGVRGRPGILVSGHDLKDIEELLEQSRDSGVDVYTHGEMIAAHYYPKLQAFEHLAGNYGGAWWRQEVEFAQFNGPILMTSNCITPVADEYKGRIFTTGVAGYPEVRHLDRRLPDGGKDFSNLVALAQACPPPLPIDEGERMGGFKHGPLLAHTPRLLELVQQGRVRRFIVIGGCDGRDLARDYYRQLAEQLPRDTIILSAGCAKYPFFKLELGDIDGVPRVLDAGQCNDCYSLLFFAQSLQKMLGLKSVNELPLSIQVAWYDQKAVAVLLALLHLGFEDFRLGPTLPAFFSPKVRELLAERWKIHRITTPADDIAAMLAEPPR